ncbi:hypothetical protein JCM11641_007357 [Rhodosporidiobolus odoratus]
MPFSLLSSGYGGTLYSLSFNPSDSPTLSVSSTQTCGSAPTWLTLSAPRPGKRPVVYTGDEFADPGTLTSFVVGQDAKLSSLGSTGAGAGPVHFVEDSQGKRLFSANYGSGSLSVVSLNDDGSFVGGDAQTVQFTGTGPNKERQEQSHIHGVYLDPTGDYLLATDLGADQLKVYYIANGDFSERPAISLATGSGPRHLVTVPPSGSSTKTLLYLVEELSSCISISEIIYPSSPSGPLSLAAIQTEITILPPDASSYPGDWTAAEIHLSPCGRYLFASNRSPPESHPESDVITIFELNAQGGVVTSSPPTYFSVGGLGPRDFSFSPPREGVQGGKYLAVSLQRTNEVAIFEVEGKELKEVARVGDLKEPTAVVWL